jgi:hypothetical protein
MKSLKIIIPALIAVLVIGGAVILVKKRKAEEAKLTGAKIYPIVVKTITPITAKTILTLPYLGVVKSDKEILINSKFAGKIEYIKELGSKVKKGEVVAKLDSTDIKAKIKEVNQNINSLTSKLSALNISLKNLLQTHQRTKELLKVKMASVEQYQTEESKIAELKAQITATKNSINSLYANKKALLQNLTYTNIRSCINGVVSAKFLNKGDIAFPAKPILKISSNEKNYILVNLPKEYKEIKYKNQFFALIPLNSTINGLKSFKAQINDKSVSNGEKVEIEVVTFKGNATTIPYNAILNINGKNYIFEVKNNKAYPREIHILAEGKREVAIKEKISSPIITAGADILLKIKAGAKIETE